MKDLSKHYGNLKSDERLKAALDAMARGDWEEAGTLSEACPKVQYVAQRDLAYTGKFMALQAMALLHAASFYQTRGAIIAALFTRDKRAYSLRRAELMTQVKAWQRFCDYAGFESDTVLKAFGLTLDTALMNDLPAGEVEPDETMIEEFYQGHLRNWA